MLKRIAKAFAADQCMLLSAALAFYTALSFAPALILVIWGTSMLGEAAQQRIVSEISSVTGARVGEVADLVIKNAAKRPALGSVAGLIAIVGILVSATTVFAQLKQAMNLVWNVTLRPEVGAVKTLIYKRVASFVMLLFASLLLLLAVLASAILTRLIDNPQRSLMQEVVWHVLNGGISLGVFILAIAAIFKFLPDVIIDWRSVWAGAAFTGALLLVGKYLIAAYFSETAIGSAYGAGGTLFVLLLWVYYSWAIVFFGAEFTRVWARQRHHRIEPRNHAVIIERKPASE